MHRYKNVVIFYESLKQQILKHFAGTFNWVQTSSFWRVPRLLGGVLVLMCHLWTLLHCMSRNKKEKSLALRNPSFKINFWQTYMGCQDIWRWKVSNNYHEKWGNIYLMNSKFYLGTTKSCLQFICFKKFMNPNCRQR